MNLISSIPFFGIIFFFTHFNSAAGVVNATAGVVNATAGVVNAADYDSLTDLGVSYASNLLEPKEIVPILNHLGIKNLQIRNPNPNTIKSLCNSNITISISLNNSFIEPFAAKRSKAALWASEHIVEFYPDAKIDLISIGSDDYEGDNKVLIQAIKNIKDFLKACRITQIDVTTIFSLNNTFQTHSLLSTAELKNSQSTVTILEYLKEYGSSLFISIYPHQLSFSLSENVNYHNLFERLVDSIFCALGESATRVTFITGCPSQESLFNCPSYLQGVIDTVNDGNLTPQIRHKLLSVFIFELFNENPQGFGLLYPNKTLRYNIRFCPDCNKTKTATIQSYKIPFTLLCIVTIVAFRRRFLLIRFPESVLVPVSVSVSGGYTYDAPSVDSSCEDLSEHTDESGDAEPPSTGSTTIQRRTWCRKIKSLKNKFTRFFK